jgi:N-acetylglucosaminyl-diphospho-decaprenol L-rhamnosyltransferase
MNHAPALSIVIVGWNVRELLETALASIYAGTSQGPSPEVILVDNASTDGTPAMVASAYPQVRLIANADNRGFTGANNQGIAAASGSYILLLNPDTEVTGDALYQLVAYLERHPEVGLVGPRLLNSDGTTQSSRRRFPTLPILFLESTWLESLAPQGMLRKHYMLDLSDERDQEVGWVTGAAMLVRRSVIDQVGMLDEGFFMYSEELDWCHRIHDAGWRVAYTPSAEIIHYGGKSSEQVAPARHIYFQSSKVRYTQKYHGVVTGEVLRLWLLGQYLWQLTLEAIKWVIGHRRPLRAARVRAYWRVLQSGLRQRQAIEL